MQHVHPNSIEFKFKWHDETGAVTGFKNGTGSFDGKVLKIGGLAIEITELISVSVKENTFFFQTTNAKYDTVNVEIWGTDLRQLEFAIHSSRSAVYASRERERLSNVGKLSDYRDSVCPFCQSTIVLTGLPLTPQVFCEYCSVLHTADSSGESQTLKNESLFRICDGCGMYSRPREFAVFYFYFLVFTFGFHHDTKIGCTACMRRSVWKMVFGNLFGILGIPFALSHLYRAYRSSNLPKEFVGLDDANSLAIKRKVDLALEKYDLIMDNVPENAGVKYNIAAGFVLKDDLENAVNMFEMSLDDCSNYWPSVHGLISCLHKLGRKKELAAVKKLWGLGMADVIAP